MGAARQLSIAAFLIAVGSGADARSQDGEFLLLYRLAAPGQEPIFGIRLRASPANPWHTMVAIHKGGMPLLSLSVPGGPPSIPIVEVLTEEKAVSLEATTVSGAFDTVSFDVDTALAAGTLSPAGPYAFPAGLLSFLGTCKPPPPGGQAPGGQGGECDPKSKCPGGNCTGVAKDLLKDFAKSAHKGALDCVGDVLDELVDDENIYLDENHEYTKPGVCNVLYRNPLIGAKKAFVSPECFCGPDDPAVVVPMLIAACVIMAKSDDSSLDLSCAIVIAEALLLPIDTRSDWLAGIHGYELMVKLLERAYEGANPMAEWTKAMIEAIKYLNGEGSIAKMKEAIKKYEELMEALSKQPPEEAKAAQERANGRMKRIQDLIHDKNWGALAEEFGIPRECVDPEAPAPDTNPKRSSLAPNAMEVGDLDGDGRPDLAVIGSAAAKFEVFPNGPEGAFGEPGVEQLRAVGRALLAADLNGDGQLDLVVATDAQELEIRLNAGSGSFPPGVTSPSLPEVSRLAAADLDGDGRPEVAMNSSAQPVIGILGNQGAGRFAPLGAQQTPAPTHDFTLADFDADGSLDVAATLPTLHRVYVSPLRNIRPGGGGVVLPNDSFPVGREPRGLAAGDLNGDGRPDIVAACAGSAVAAQPTSGQLSVLIAVGPRMFGTSIDVTLRLAPWDAALGDLNGDGRLDAALSQANGGAMAVLLGLGAGPFFESPLFEYQVGGSPETVAVLDVEGDGDLDVVCADSSGVFHLLWNGRAVREIVCAQPEPRFLRGDSNGDRRLDIADAVNTLAWLFTSATDPRCLDAADVNDDGAVDISDPIGTLGYLFQGSAPPAPPGPDSCGRDPAHDLLPPCAAPAC